MTEKVRTVARFFMDSLKKNVPVQKCNPIWVFSARIKGSDGYVDVDHLPKKNIDSKANGDQEYKKHKTAH